MLRLFGRVSMLIFRKSIQTKNLYPLVIPFLFNCLILAARLPRCFLVPSKLRPRSNCFSHPWRFSLRNGLLLDIATILFAKFCNHLSELFSFVLLHYHYPMAYVKTPMIPVYGPILEPLTEAYDILDYRHDEPSYRSQLQKPIYRLECTNQRKP